MGDFVFKLSPNILLGSYITSRLGQLASEYSNRFMLIVDPVLKDVGAFEKIELALKNRNIDFFVFDEISDGAGTQIVEDALKLARNACISGIIAAGGSRAINIGRAIASLFNEKSYIYDYIEGFAPQSNSLPCICIPTTGRDTFVFTDRIPLIDSRNNQLKLLKTQYDLNKLVLFDSNMMLSLTANQRTSISLETLCYAVEGYISQRSNFFSDTILEKAIELLVCSLNGATSKIVTTPAEVLFTQGSCMTSLGIASSSPGVATILSLSIYARYKISRSLTSAILFPYILADAINHKADKLSKITKVITGEEAASLSDNIRTRLAAANLPTRLKDLSVNMDQLALAAEDASQLEYMNGLSRSMTADDLFEFIKQAY